MTPGETILPPPAPVEDTIPDYLRELEVAAAYLPVEQQARLRRAWQVGAAAHADQTRKSGEPYITHPVAVAAVLAEQKVDVETLVAAILHDTIEDTPLTREQLAAEFGETVAELVEGVTKLDKIKFSSRQEAAAESFRKMMLAMARDLRVILIKLADRLHNMRTLGAQPGPARERIARETLEVYAPIAQRLGMNKIKAELQDLGFHALYPIRHMVLEKRTRNQPLVRREALASIEAQLAQRLTSAGLQYRLVGRVKSPWSIYNKMQNEGKTFTQVMDVFGYRIIVGSAADCYHALGVAHSVFKPLDGRFRDFIAIPKANGYQSLHTVLFGPYGAPIEVQIRTEEMDLIAERGIAAHWAYKHGGDGPNSAQSRAHSWIAGLLESQRATGSSLEFLENVKVDLFPDEVYLFTPKGDIMSLPRNSTTLDFAYARARRRQAGAAAHPAGQRPARVDRHRQILDAAAAVAGVRRHWQGADRDPRAAQEPAARGRGAARPSHARPRAGTARHLARPPAAGAAGRVPGRGALPAPRGIDGRHRARQLDAGAGRACIGATRSGRRRDR